MPEYIVEIPVAGSISVAVEADSEDDAKTKAMLRAAYHQLAIL